MACTPKDKKINRVNLTLLGFLMLKNTVEAILCGRPFNAFPLRGDVCQWQTLIADRSET